MSESHNPHVQQVQDPDGGTWPLWIVRFEPQRHYKVFADEAEAVLYAQAYEWALDRIAPEDEEGGP